MHDEEVPEKKPLTFKEATFERVNAARGEAGATPDPNAVATLLARNKAAGAPGEKPLDLRKKRSRRRLDYVLVMIGGNGAIVLAMVLGERNVVSVIYGFSGVILFSVGVSWVMWQVMDDY